MLNSPYCSFPFYHRVTLTSGNSMPCCNWQYDLKPNINHTEYWNSEFAEDLRKQMSRNEIPKGCKSCVDIDKNGGVAPRISSFDFIDIDFISPELTYEEVDLSNICNLKCRMCDSSRSSKLIKDDLLYGENHPFDWTREVFKKQESGWTLTDDNAKSVKMLRFLGGEPLLHQPQIIEAMKKLKDLKRLHEVTISLNTNMMTFLTDEFLDLAKHLYCLDLTLSIDGFGKLNEYIRSGSNWEEFINHLNKLVTLKKSSMKNISLSFIYVPQLLNINKLDELYSFMKEYSDVIRISNPIRLVSPISYSLFNIPNEIISDMNIKLDKWIIDPKFEFIKEHIRIIKNYMNDSEEKTLSTIDWYIEFHHMNNLFDKTRNQRLEDYNPELFNLINKCRR